MWKQNDKIEMLKVECLNNSLWNHLDKTIVAFIVQRLESDRMRQKRRNTARAPLAGWKGDASSLVAGSPLLLEDLRLTAERPPLGALVKRGCLPFFDWQAWSQAAVAASAWQGIFQYSVAWKWPEQVSYGFLHAVYSRVSGHEAFES